MNEKEIEQLKKANKRLSAVLALTLGILLVAFGTLAGVTNFQSAIHIDDTTDPVGTGTPVLRVNNTGSGKVVEFLDAGTPVWSLNDGGGIVSSGSIDLSAGLDLNGNTLTLDSDADTTMVASVDDALTITLGAATGHIDIETGNVKLGNGAPEFTQDGEDLYVEGTFELSGDLFLPSQDVYSLTVGQRITPSFGTYHKLTTPVEPIGSATANSDIAEATVNKLLILENINATRVITFDATGGTIECGAADIVLGPTDIITFLWNDSVWLCVNVQDN